MIRASVESRDHGVLTTGDGYTAAALATVKGRALILLNVCMPDLDSYETCKTIRRFSTVPIIMLAALAEEKDVVRGLDAGADDLLAEPFSLEELLARVRPALQPGGQLGC
jgi:DNA-binding response OmpR family regulator